MAELQDWDVSAANNNDAAPDGFPEGMLAGSVNNSAREVMAVIKRWYDDTNFSIATTGTANAYAMAAARTISAYAQGQVFCFEANFANTGAATLNVDAVGAKDLRKNYNTALVSGDIVAGQFVAAAYQAGEDFFQIISPTAVNVSSKLDNIVEDTTPQLGGDLDLNGNNIDFPTTANISDCLDEDDMSSDSATALATQQSIKAYVDTEVAGVSAVFELIASGTVSSGASLDLTDLTSTYYAYRLVYSNLRPASSSVDHYIRFSNDNGSTFRTGGSDYEYAGSGFTQTTGATSAASNGAGQIQINGTSSASGAGLYGSGTIDIINPMGSGEKTQILFSIMGTSGNRWHFNGGGEVSTAEANDAVQFLFSSGNIAEMTYRLYGLRSA